MNFVDFFTCSGYAIILLIFIFIAIAIYAQLTLGICKCKTSMNGKTVIITGGDSGIGKEIVLDLASRGARIIIASLILEQGEICRQNIIEQTRNPNIIVKKLDLASFRSVRKFCEDILKTEQRVDVFINNAGLLNFENIITEDSNILSMQVNHLGPFLMTNLLLDLMKNSAPSRIINVSSFGHYFSAFFDPENLNKFTSVFDYCNAKLCNILFTKTLATKLKGTNVEVYCLNPGLTRTPMLNFNWHWLIKPTSEFLVKLISKSPSEGAQTAIHLAVAKDVGGISGDYFSDCRVTRSSRKSIDPSLARIIWHQSELLTRL